MTQVAGIGGPGSLGPLRHPGPDGMIPEGKPAVSFADTLKNALGEVSKLDNEASDAISAFLRGEPIEIHQVTAAAEEAGIAIELLVEIRNKITEAYRAVIQMQQ